MYNSQLRLFGQPVSDAKVGQEEAEERDVLLPFYNPAFSAGCQ